MRHILYDGHSKGSVVNEGLHVMNNHIHEPIGPNE